MNTSSLTPFVLCFGLVSIASGCGTASSSGPYDRGDAAADLAPMLDADASTGDSLIADDKLSVDDTPVPPEDLGSPPDAVPPPPDVTPTGTLFSRCSREADCAGIPNGGCYADFPGGLCLRTCTRNTDCTAAGVCLDGVCFPRCSPGTRSCLAYGAFCGEQGPGVYSCVPSCPTTPAPGALACFSATPCDPWLGFCATDRFTGADNGAPCRTKNDCHSRNCFGERFADGQPSGFVGGYCTSSTGRPADRAYTGSTTLPRGNCPPGGIAIPATGSLTGSVEADAALCYRGCTADGDCRSGYRCQHNVHGSSITYANGFCYPAACGAARPCPAGYSCQTVRVGTTTLQLCGACTPTCAGRPCGPDGCGGTCGTCPTGQTCSAVGSCSCTPTCAGRTCGPNGCGGACGTCPTGQTCNTAGTCSCTRDCTGRTCGSDGCGGTCGTCPTGQMCNTSSGACVACVRNCTGRTCGPDGCGGTCGSCPTGMECGTVGTCAAAPCDPVRQTGCATGQRCTISRTGAPTCTTSVGTTPIGFPCVIDGDCGRRAFCATIGGSQVCRNLCRTDTDCSGGRCAIPIDGTTTFRVCTRTCDPVSGSGCMAGDGCVLFDTGTSAEVTDCLPEGLSTRGTSCSGPDGCRAVLSCVASTCREVCTAGGACSSGTCSRVTGWTRYGACIR